MNTNIAIFIKSILTAVIELLLFIPLLILSGLATEGFEEYEATVRFLLIILPIGVYILYLLFSNTKYISLSSFLLRYRLNSNNHRIVRVIISNTIFYGLLGIFYWLQADNVKGYLINLIRILILLEFGACFIPKVGTRMSLFILKIKWAALSENKSVRSK